MLETNYLRTIIDVRGLSEREMIGSERCVEVHVGNRWNGLIGCCCGLDEWKEWGTRERLNKKNLWVQSRKLKRKAGNG